MDGPPLPHLRQSCASWPRRESVLTRAVLGLAPMLPLMIAFTLFHLVAGTASLGLGVRLLTPDERALWNSKPALFVAELLCWIYPAIAFVAGSFAWAIYNGGGHHAFPLML